MTNKIDILNEVRSTCDNDEQFDLIAIASVIELSGQLNKEDIYLQKLNDLKDQNYDQKFPQLYQYLLELSDELAVVENIDSEEILADVLEIFFDVYYLEHNECEDED